MYLSFYGLEREPFHITPDPDFLYLSPSHKEAFATIVYGVEQRKGFVALTGEVGTGKTTVLRAYLKRIDSSKIRAIYLFNPSLTFHDLLRILLRELGVENPEEKHEPTMLEQLQWALLKEYEAKRNVALIVDEAQNMPVETLERMRMLSNLETTQDKLLQIVLVGQPELDAQLARHELRQLTQRIAVKAHIRALSQDESEAYIAHRLMQAGCIREQIFSNGALKAIVRHCQGTPRALNIACDNALIAGFGGQEEVVSLPTAKEVLRDLKGVGSRAPKSKPIAIAAGLAAAAVVLVGLALVSGGGMSASNLDEDATVQLARAEEPAHRAAAPDTESGKSEVRVLQEEEQDDTRELVASSDLEKRDQRSTQDADETVPVGTTPEATEERVQLAARTTAAMDTRTIALQRIAERSRDLEQGRSTLQAEAVAEATQETANNSDRPGTHENDDLPAAEAAPLQVAAASNELESAREAAPESQPEREAPTLFSPEPVTSEDVDSTISSGLEGEASDSFSSDAEIRKTVLEGDQLLRILVQVYGFHSPPLIEAVLERNPQISDIDYIRAGDILVLPAPHELNLAEARKQRNSDRNPS